MPTKTRLGPIYLTDLPGMKCAISTWFRSDASGDAAKLREFET